MEKKVVLLPRPSLSPAFKRCSLKTMRQMARGINVAEKSVRRPVKIVLEPNLELETDEIKTVSQTKHLSYVMVICLFALNGLKMPHVFQPSGFRMGVKNT